MDAQFLMSIGLGLAWLAVICIGVASLVLAYVIGHKYVFTSAGLSRVGPHIGDHLASKTFTYRDATYPLGHFILQKHPTLLVFLGLLSQSTEEAPIKDVLIPDLRRFAALTGQSMQILIFCIEPDEAINQSLGGYKNLTILALSHDHHEQLAADLCVRAVPYALLLDARSAVLAKGLANHFAHLCWIVTKGGQLRSSRDDLARIAHLCHPMLPAALQVGLEVNAAP